MNEIICGDAVEEMSKLTTQSIDLVVTSPVYANQRRAEYGGVSERDYPAFSLRWMAEAHRLLTPTGSVALVISPHLKAGVISNYVLKTRLALQEWGWYECGEFPWIKSSAAPLGNRRSWESILWYGKASQPYCDPKANGQPSDRIGLEASKGVGSYIDGGQEKCRSEIARCRDYVVGGPQ